MTRRYRLGSLLLAASLLAIAFLLKGRWVEALVFIVLGLIGVFGAKQLRSQFGVFWFVAFMLGAAYGVIAGLQIWLLLVSAVASLAFWDLDAFQNRLDQVEADEATRQLERSHLKRLLVALGLGLALGMGGLAFQINLSLGWAIILGLVIILSIRLGIEALKGKEETL